MDAQVGVEVLDLGQGRDVHRQQVGVVGDNGAVIMVVCQVLIEVVGHAGVEDGVHALVQQGHDVAVQKLGRVADGVRGDGLLPLDVQAPGGFGGEDHLEVQVGKEGVPKGQVLVHVQPEGDADLAAGTVAAALALEGAEILVLELHQVRDVDLLLAQGTGTAVAGDEAAAAVEAVDGQGAVVRAELTGGGPGLVGELL